MGVTELLRLWRSRASGLWQKDRGLYTSTADQMLQLGEPLMAYDVLAEGLKTFPADVRLRQLMALALLRSHVSDTAESILLELEREGNQDEETIGLLARIHKERWERERTNADAATEELSLARDYYRKAYDLAGGYWSGINAATMALLSGQQEEADGLARKVRNSCSKELGQNDIEGVDNYWLLATLAEAALILEDWPEADSMYRRAAEVGRRRFGALASTRHNASLILDYLGRSKMSIEEILRISPVVVFSGHMIDRAGRATPRFPPELEGAVREAIRERLEKINPGFGFSSAACGSDILFLETLLGMGADAHIVLPYNEQRFLKDSVAIRPEGNWKTRYESILEKATEVLTASDQRIESGELSYEYADLVLLGLASTRARQLGAELVPLAVWDGQKGGVGGTARSVERWRDLGLQIEVIDLATILEDVAGNSKGGTQTGHQQEREMTERALAPEIMSLLFADALHFSKLTEDQIPLFLNHFLGTIAELLQQTSYQPVMKNTWGDGLFMVFQSVQAAGGFALELCDLINRTKWEDKSLPAELNLRIALHAGPVFQCVDPISEHQNFFGSHVSRAARIEPITPPGQVYASQGFAALAAAHGVQSFVCDYVGQVPLAKGYGTYATYHVHRRSG